MSDKAPTVCLAMIVKNEAHVIKRCLDSVKDTFTEIVIHDTGSTDDTVEIIGKWIKDNDKHGYVDTVPWVNFGVNRSKVLECARYAADYTFMLDADETLSGSIDVQSLVHDTYQMSVHLNNVTFYRNFLFKNTHEWRYGGVVHEYPVCDNKDFTTGYFTSELPYIVSHHDGARSRDPDKYVKDVQLLEDIRQPTSRDVFYLAQSYRDAGDTDSASECYYERTEMGGWFQEVAYSWYQLGILGNNPECHLKAYETDPRRAESLLAIGKHYMAIKQWHTARLYLQEAYRKSPHLNMLFREDDVYQWRAAMELAVCDYYCDNYSDSYDMNASLLKKELPPNIRIQVEKNSAFAKDKVDESADDDE